MTSLGWHWMATATGCVPERLTDPAGVEAALASLAKVLQLTPVGGPVARRTEGGGLVAFVLLAESHASIHVDGPAVFADVFSCRRFDPAACEAWLAEAFGSSAVESRVLERSG